MRIAQVCPYSIDSPGGVQGQVLGLSSAMRAKGHEVEIIAPCSNKTLGTRCVGSIASVPANGSVAPIALSPKAFLETQKAIFETNFDVIHIHEPFVPMVSLAALAKIDSSHISVATFHRSGVSLSYLLFGKIFKKLLSKLDLCTAVSLSAQKTANQVFGQEIELTFNGIDATRFLSLPVQKPTKFSILFIGRHEQRKGLGVLIDALSMIQDDLDVWIIGKGPQTKELKQRAKGDKRIKWLGVVTDKEVESYLSKSNVLCAPSISGESFGVILLEAMASNTAVIASDIEGYRDVCRNMQEAILFPPGGALALAEAIKNLLAHPFELDRLVKAAKVRVQEFSMEKLASIYLETYIRIGKAKQSG